MSFVCSSFSSNQKKKEGDEKRDDYCIKNGKKVGFGLDCGGSAKQHQQQEELQRQDLVEKKRVKGPGSGPGRRGPLGLSGSKARRIRRARVRAAMRAISTFHRRGGG